MLLEPGTLEAFGLYLVRTSALVLAAPLLGGGAMFSGYKIALISVLSILLYAVTGDPLVDATPAAYVLYVLREIMIGFALAFVLQLVLLAVRVSADLVGHEMGFAMAAVVDPAMGVRTGLIARFYETLFLLALLAVNGHHWLLRALSESYERAPVGVVRFEANLPTLVVDAFAQLFAAGITFAAPVLVLLTLVSAMIGLLTRAVPHLNILEIGFNLRICAGLFAMFVFLPAVEPAMNRLLEHLMHGLEAGLDALGA